MTEKQLQTLARRLAQQHQISAELADLAAAIIDEEQLSDAEAVEKARREQVILQLEVRLSEATGIDSHHLGHVLSLALQIIEEDHPHRAFFFQDERNHIYTVADGLRFYLKKLGWMDEEDEAEPAPEPAPTYSPALAA